MSILFSTFVVDTCTPANIRGMSPTPRRGGGSPLWRWGKTGRNARVNTKKPPGGGQGGDDNGKEYSGNTRQTN